MTETAPDRAAIDALAVQARTSEKAFDELYGLFFPQIYGFVMRRVQHRENCEDVVAEIFQKTFLHLNEFSPKKASFRTWIFTIARHTLIDYYRRERNINHPALVDIEAAAEVPAPGSDPAQIMMSQQDKAVVHAALHTLPEREQQVVALRYLDGYSNQEIAEMVGISPNNVGVILHRSLQKMEGILSSTHRV